MRPEVTAGPIPRSSRPLQVSADQPPFGFSSLASASSVFFAGSAFFATAGLAGSAFAAVRLRGLGLRRGRGLRFLGGRDERDGHGQALS